MRAIFSKLLLSFRDRCIEAPDLGFTSRSYILTPERRVLLWAGISRWIPAKAAIHEAKLRVVVVNRKSMPGTVSIARLRKEVDFTSASWLMAAGEASFQQPGGGEDCTAWRPVSFVPDSD